MEHLGGERPVVVLAGGTGGAKLARGVYDHVGPELVVIANTGDDIEIYNAYVSPDPDLVSYWLADLIDTRGWGIHDDTFEEMERMRAEGDEVWFQLGDHDMEICSARMRRMRDGARFTETLLALAVELGIQAAVLPMSDDPVRTQIKVGGQWLPFQYYMIRAGAPTPIEDVAFEGIENAKPAPEALDAIARARAILIGPSNPVISIGPILAVPGMREALIESPAPVVAVSPIVGGQVIKGPTEPFMEWAGYSRDAQGIATAYRGLIDGLVSDEPTAEVAMLQTDVLMANAQSRKRLARETLDFAEALAR